MKLKIYPPVVLFVSMLLTYGLSRFIPVLQLGLPYPKFISAVFTLIGLLVLLLAAIAFWRVDTTVHPHTPNETKTVVQTGLFAVSRNPMYVGMLFILLGVCYFYSTLTGFIAPVFFVAYITAFQIKPEEEVLAAKFGEDYMHYKSTVRRWL